MSESINRAFMYGESVFTTMRMREGEVQDWDLHFERLKKGVDFVFGPFTDHEGWALDFKNRLEDRCLNETGDKILRLTAYLESSRGLKRSGFCSIGELRLDLSVSTLDLLSSQPKNPRLRTCAAPVKPLWWPSYLKTGNYLETILAQKMFLKVGEDDLLFLSPKDSVLESSVANIFVVEGRRLLTPPAGPQVLEGVMRKKVLESAKEFFDESAETEISIDQLLKARAIFGTNSLRGPFLIDSVDGFDYTHDQEFLGTFSLLRKRVLS